MLRLGRAGATAEAAPDSFSWRSGSKCEAATMLSQRSSRPFSSGRLSRRSSLTWGWTLNRRPAAERARRGKTSPPEPRRQSPDVTNTTPQAATPNRSRGGMGRRVSAAPSESRPTLRTWLPANLGTAQGSAETALRDVTVAESNHLRPPQARQTATPRAFETTRPSLLAGACVRLATAKPPHRQRSRVRSY